MTGEAATDCTLCQGTGKVAYLAAGGRFSEVEET